MAKIVEKAGRQKAKIVCTPEDLKGIGLGIDDKLNLIGKEVTIFKYDGTAKPMEIPI